MTAQIQTTNDNERRTPWQALRAWFTALDEGMNFDPHEYTNSMVQLLSKRMEQLETRMNELDSQIPTTGGSHDETE